MNGIIVRDIVVVFHLLPEDVPLAVRQRSWFLQRGVPALWAWMPPWLWQDFKEL
jgi:hypothetical protein